MIGGYLAAANIYLFLLLTFIYFSTFSTFVSFAENIFFSAFFVFMANLKVNRLFDLEGEQVCEVRVGSRIDISKESQQARYFLLMLQEQMRCISDFVSILPIPNPPYFVFTFKSTSSFKINLSTSNIKMYSRV